MSTKRVVFLGGKGIGAYCLEYLINKSEDLGIEVIAALTKGKNVLDGKKTVASLAADNQITLVENLDDLPECEFIISVQYHAILKQKHIDQAKTMALNLHMAPLPEYRGCNQFSFAIIDEKKVFGTTLHEMTLGIDDGDIIAERRFEISNDIWVEDLYKKTLKESEILFVQNIEKIVQGNYIAISQQQLLKERGASFHLRNEISSLKIIDENWSEEKKKKYVRATYMSGFEPPFSMTNGEKKYYNKQSF